MSLTGSGQAVLPRVNPLLKGQVLPPNILASNSGAAQDAYNTTDNAPLQELRIQNCLNKVVKVAINTVANDNSFHFVIKAATGTDDGTVDPLIIPMSWGVKQVSVFGPAGSYRISVIAVTNGQYQGRI